MAIHFYCPLGHRLAVPDDLAGKKGRCPLCHQKVVVPVADPRASGKPKSGGGPRLGEQFEGIENLIADELGLRKP